jgi:hypothetical protein
MVGAYHSMHLIVAAIESLMMDFEPWNYHACYHSFQVTIGCGGLHNSPMTPAITVFK